MAAKDEKKTSVGAKPVYIIPSVEEPTPYEQAEEKAQNPLMTTANNPLAESPAQGLQDRIVDTNMERLFKDAKMRKGPNGNVYAGFMQQRFGG